MNESSRLLISEVNSQPLVPVKLETASKEQCANTSLPKLTHQTFISLACSESSPEKPAVSELTHQTLLDVNSQPFSEPSDQDGNTLISFRAFGGKCYDYLNATKENTEQNNKIMVEDFNEQFATGRMFSSLSDLRTAAYEYGKKYNVALTTSKSDKTKVYLICKHGGQYRQNKKAAKDNVLAITTEKDTKTRIRKSQKTGCKCMVYARCFKESFWVIRKSVAEHNHPIAQDPRAYAMYRSLSPENLLAVRRLLKERVSVSLIVKSLKASGVTNVIAKDIENIQQDMKRKDIITCPQETENSLKEELLATNSTGSSPAQ
ncbi:hypothetical protein G6F56_003620 [Rhizopus delemar]|uniref:FAR1 domain-containing protein n=1 Tax=Rhizopus stolonifer TaxID=4846 RepID=A0A367KQG5_RHIST|nr:hypothetical protein G6F56_003620 [Rhizopus delemar]RCI04397.1 hypothetical protein CU098_010985 [Rhizopus stolonifer]